MILRRRRYHFAILFSYLFLFPFFSGKKNITGFVTAIVVHGGSALAVAGRDSVALAIDERIGTTASMIDTVSEDNSSSLNKEKTDFFRRVLQVDDLCLISGIGCESHTQALLEDIKMEISIAEYQQSKFFSISDLSKRKRRKNNFNTISHLVSSILYNSKSLQVCPIIVGLDEILSTKEYERLESMKYRPRICCQDSIGACTFSDNFAAVGSSRSSLLGACETLFKPNMNIDELRDCTVSCMESSLDRDCQGGYGFRLYILTRNGISCWKYQGRMD